MAFVVEDGTSKTDSNSYISVADCKVYLTDLYGVTDPLYVASDTLIQQALVRGTQYLDSRYRTKFKGIKTSYAQSLEWPRLDAEDASGYYIDGNSIPTQLKQATVELARRFNAGDDILPDIEAGAVKQERVEGAITMEYFSHVPGPPILTLVKSLMAGIIVSGNPMVRS